VSQVEVVAQLLCLGDIFLKAIEIHDFVPCRNEVPDEFLLGVGASVNFRNSAQLCMRSKNQINPRARPFALARFAQASAIAEKSGQLTLLDQANNAFLMKVQANSSHSACDFAPVAVRDAGRNSFKFKYPTDRLTMATKTSFGFKSAENSPPF
jgi:hypothetical protein